MNRIDCRIDCRIDWMLIEEALRIEGNICEKILRLWGNDGRMNEVILRELVRGGWNHLVKMN